MSKIPTADLAALVERFREETGYPTDEDKEQKQLRAEWAEKLRPENIASISRLDMSAVTNGSIYRNPKYVVQVAHESEFIKKHEDEKFESLLRSIQHLCWGDGEIAARFAEVDSRAVKEGATTESGYQKISGGFCSKLLAICHPDTFLPIPGQNQANSCRERALELMGLPRPTGKNFWYKSVDANDRLREFLSPYFSDDTYGMASFLYWLMKQEPLPNGGRPGEPSTPKEFDSSPDLSALAKELLVDVGFLEVIVQLLKEKGRGQVILYGPPGTGKTYLAQKLAEVLAPDESCRALVQFHPSTSYEDFFEGYRPAGTGDDGGIRYELTPGPLARMAEDARNAPADQQHVMVIDEINRGNLPRVLGELLFLLEYRGESIYPLYRPDTPFSLPENLWFIGTMNTADRSIALVDAALRRRFHFVPFFPDSGPIAGLLGRWLERNEQPAWVGRLVDTVNDELKGDLAGSHLLLGPSHFMKRYGSTPTEQQERLRRIWEYNIEPFIEDQFFGDPDRIEHYRFDSDYARHGPAADPAGEADADAEDATQAAATRPSSDDAAEDV